MIYITARERESTGEPAANDRPACSIFASPWSYSPRMVSTRDMLAAFCRYARDGCMGCSSHYAYRNDDDCDDVPAACALVCASASVCALINWLTDCSFASVFSMAA